MEVFLSRDLDSRITEREVAAVQEWLHSDKVHIPALTFVDIYIFIILDSSPHEGLGHRIPKTVGVFMGCQAGQCCHESTMGGDLGQNAARSLGSAHN